MVKLYGLLVVAMIGCATQPPVPPTPPILLQQPKDIYLDERQWLFDQFITDECQCKRSCNFND